ncbi:aldo-keto reductase [Auriscalpium vulgare]|uniref:Aldo-keto reductase n=1 Tax=Auriscalpium vulgare TaxID=40419 RepID=A0ACB8RC79_9AGAM|nr:aldo-keto reductase [Auriscalpium vulgare]
MSLNLQSTITLNDGTQLPRFGLGVYEMTEDEAYQSTKWALEAGYRLIDTADWYDNEAACGRALRDFCAESGVPRSEIYYTTKLKHNLGAKSAYASIRRSLAASGLDYIDLYLIHGPPGGPARRRESWAELVRAQKDGLLRSIGVSNFGVRHLEEMRVGWEQGGVVGDDEWVGVKPSVNQVDLHPFMTRDDITSYCMKHDITLEAWAPLVRTMRFNHPVVQRLATKHAKQPAQVLLRYSLQRGYVAIPKSVSRERIVSNADVFGFELSEVEMQELHALNEDLVTDWEVTTCP